MNTALLSTRKTSEAALAHLFLRATLGLNLLMHGISRLLAGADKFAASLAIGFHNTLLPQPLVLAFAQTLPWIETAIGFFVLLGLFTRVGLSVGAFLILVLTFGTTLRQDWPTATQQLIYGAVFAALLAFSSANRYSVDALVARKR